MFANNAAWFEGAWGFCGALVVTGPVAPWANAAGGSPGSNENCRSNASCTRATEVLKIFCGLLGKRTAKLLQFRLADLQLSLV